MLNKLSALSTKIIVLILVLYTSLAGVITLIVLNSSTKTKILKEYSESLSDEYVKLTVRVWEERKSSQENKTDFESTKYGMRAYLEKTEKSTDLEVKNIKYYVTGKTKKGKLLFDESSSTYSITKNSLYTPSTSTNIVPNSIFKQSISVNSSTEEKEIINNVPVELFINVNYTLIFSNKEENRSLKSKIIISNPETENFSKYENGEIGSNDLVINESEAIDVMIDCSLSTIETSTEEVKKDSFDFETTLNSTYLGEKEINDFSVEVFGKISTRDTDEEIFSNYIRMYTCYGSAITSKTRVDTIYSNYQINEAYDIEELYVKTIVNFTDGTSSIRKVKINLNEK